MKKKMIGAMMRSKLWLWEQARKFKEDERGASDFVALIVIIVIILAVAVIFRENLKTMAEQVFEQLGGFIGGGE